MTNPTSNFGWQMPTSTDLVTDLPADFEVFGQAVDTSMADLKGGTTGQILSKATNADMDFTWITNDVGDITAVNVTAPITGGGTSGAVTIGVNAASTSASGVVQLSDSTSTTSSILASTPTATKSAYDLAAAAIPKSTVTTAGDVIYATGSGAVTRLGIGTAGQVLTVNSGATAPQWSSSAAGGMTLISTTTLSGTSTSITVASNTYKDLVAYIYGVGTASANFDFNFRINSITANTYLEQQTTGNSGGTVVSIANNFTAMNLNNAGYEACKGATTDNAWNVTFWDCNSTNRKIVTSNGSYLNGSSANVVMSARYSVRDATSAITNITVIANTSLTGGTVQLYGVK